MGNDPLGERVKRKICLRKERFGSVVFCLFLFSLLSFSLIFFFLFLSCMVLCDGVDGLRYIKPLNECINSKLRFWKPTAFVYLRDSEETYWQADCQGYPQRMWQGERKKANKTKQMMTLYTIALFEKFSELISLSLLFVTQLFGQYILLPSSIISKT